VPLKGSAQRFLNIHSAVHTPSTINDISFLGPHFGSSEPKQPPGGKMRLPSHETGFDLADALHPARYRDNARAIQATLATLGRKIFRGLAPSGLSSK
jgi:hypothetical protein